MAMQAGKHSPQSICNAFVEQYYHILHDAPDQVHKFYKDTSRIGRAGSDGVMEYVTTLPEINEKIVSMDFSKYLTKLETADAVLSLNGGAFILVTGSLTLISDDVCQRFTQTFFLAPQETGGYFVLNDILRILSESDQENGRNQKDVSVALSVADTTPAPVGKHLTENNVAGGELLNPPIVNGTAVETNPSVKDITVENTVTVEPPMEVSKEYLKKTPIAASPPPAQKGIPKKHLVSASPPPPAQKDAIKKTYASIVKDNKECPPAVKPKIAKPVVSKPLAKVVDGSAKPLQAAETTPASTSVTKNCTSHDEGGYSIFVRGLPSRSTDKMVGEEFKKFGAIKPGGIQVRNNKFDEFCFGFVEFESQQSMQAAIEASPIFIAEKEITIEKKLTSTRVVNGVVTNASGGPFQYGRGANNFRGQGGGYVNNAGYRGADNFNRRDDGGEYFNRRYDGGNHYNRRNDDGYKHQRGSPQGNGYQQNGNGFHQQRPFQNENGRYARVNNDPKQTPAAARVNDGSKQTPAAARVNDGSKQTPAAASA